MAMQDCLPLIFAPGAKHSHATYNGYIPAVERGRDQESSLVGAQGWLRGRFTDGFRKGLNPTHRVFGNPCPRPPYRAYMYGGHCYYLKCISNVAL